MPATPPPTPCSSSSSAAITTCAWAATTGNRLITLMDTLGQRAGYFSPAQEQELRKLRQQLAGLLE